MGNSAGGTGSMATYGASPLVSAKVRSWPLGITLFGFSDEPRRA